MNKLFLLSFVILLSGFAASQARAADPVYVADATTCPAAPSGGEPDFSGPECETKPYWQIDPQGRDFWLRATLTVSDDLITSERPLGLYVSGKASSEAFLNGVRLGANGAPGPDEASETPGKMDTVFYAPRDSVKLGENDIVLRMSSHHGFLKFKYPLHWIAIGEYGSPTSFLLNQYWPSLIPFGALMLGAIYFATMGFTDRWRLNTVLLILVSLFAAAQLFVEIFRGLTPYLYPAHEWRMILIVLFSIGFSLCLLAYIFTKYLPVRWMFAAAAIVLLTVVALTPGYDGKAGFAVFAAAAISAAIAGWAAWKKMSQARLHVLVLSLFAASILVFETQFLNVIFFYEVTALLLALFVAQAITVSKERKMLEDERARTRQLELSLERANQSDTDHQLTITSAGKMEVVPIAKIAHCKGAGDYVEIMLEDGRSLLHGGSLTQMEEELPRTFLRVHRSYLVNTNFVRALKREHNGVGVLQLSTDAEIPVSRRIMPKVRSALQ